MRMKGWNRFCSRAMLLVVVLVSCMQATAQSRSGEKLKRAIKSTVDFVDYVLNDVDTMYVEGNLYNLTIMPEYSYSYEHYKFAGKTQSIDIAPTGRNTLTFNVGWRWLIVGYSIDLQKGRQLKEFNTSLYSARFALDLYYRKCNDGYCIKRFYDGKEQLQEFDKGFNGLTVKQLGAGLCYAFNKRFSYAAAYGQSTTQRVSAGSLILGAEYNQQEFAMDHERLDPTIRGLLSKELGFERIKFNNVNISIGYAYNWVFAKNFLAGISVAPAISYKMNETAFPDKKDANAGIGLDFTTRAGLTYNNKRYYAGASLESHTYSNNKNNLNITNGFGVLEVYAGFNFWRRK